jgi:hypothetical protein
MIFYRDVLRETLYTIHLLPIQGFARIWSTTPKRWFSDGDMFGPIWGNSIYIYKNNVIINPNHWVGDMFITFYNPNQVSFWNMLGTAFWLGLLKGFAPTARPAHSHRRLRCWHSLAVSGNKWYHDSYIASICKCQPLSKVHIDVELLCIHAITTSLQSTYLNMLKQFKTS